MDKVVFSTAQAIQGIGDGASLAVGGFGLWHTDRVRLRDPRRGASAASRPTPTICGVDDWTSGSCFRDRDAADHRVLRRRETRSSLASTSPARSRSSSLPRAPLPSDWRGRVRHTGVLHPPPGWAPRSRRGFPWRYAAGGTIGVASPSKGTREVEWIRSPARSCSRPSSPTSGSPGSQG